MALTRRIRGLIGTALTWGVMGAIAGIPVYFFAMRAWNFRPAHWRRLVTTFRMWEVASFTWGIACGLSFGIALMLLERRRPLSELTPTRVAAWGAAAGALFPALITSRAIIGGGNLFYFGGTIVASALTGAVWARMSVAIAKRVPDEEMLSVEPAVGNLASTPGWRRSGSRRSRRISRATRCSPSDASLTLPHRRRLRRRSCSWHPTQPSTSFRP